MRKYIIESFHADGYDRFAAVKDLQNMKKWVVHFWELDEWIEFGEKSKKKKEGDIISGGLFIDLVCKHKKIRKREKYEQTIEMSSHIEIILKVEEVIDKYSLCAHSKYFDEKVLVEFESKANYEVGDTVYLEGSLELEL